MTAWLARCREHLIAELPPAAAADAMAANGLAALVRLAIVSVGTVDQLLWTAATRVDHDELARALLDLGAPSPAAEAMASTAAERSARRRP